MARKEPPVWVPWRKRLAEDEELSDSAVLAAHTLTIWMDNKTGLCNPSIGTVARYMHRKRRSVQTCLRELEDAGYLARVGKGGRTPGGKARSNTYRATYPNRARTCTVSDPSTAHEEDANRAFGDTLTVHGDAPELRRMTSLELQEADDEIVF